MNIRRATFDDLEVVMHLIDKVVPLMQAVGNHQWDENYPDRAAFTKDITEQQLWVATQGDIIVGVIAITHDQEPAYMQVPGWNINEEAIVAHRLAVDPDHRGKGIAEALLMQCEEVAHNDGIKLLRLDTQELNRPMQNLFLKIGYQLGGEIELDGRLGQRFLAYEKRLL